jgi:hypothetical protein
MLALAALALVAAEGGLEAILDRVAEEAEVFRNLAPKIIARETLRQRAQKPLRRFRPRIGKSALEPPKMRLEEREIVSEYGFSTLQEDPEALHEFRTVISVDGRAVAGHSQARERLTLGLTSADDRVKRKLLSQFERHGLLAAAVDFGQLILLFTRDRRGGYQFELRGEERLGAEPVLVVSYRQLEGPGAFTIFEGNRGYRARIEGEIWARQTDFVPLRIAIRTTASDASGKREIVHSGVVDYFPSAYGVLLPAAVRYEKLVDRVRLVENVASYSNYRMFSADAEIRFETAEPQAPPR